MTLLRPGAGSIIGRRLRSGAGDFNFLIRMSREYVSVANQHVTHLIFPNQDERVLSHRPQTSAQRPVSRSCRTWGSSAQDYGQQNEAENITRTEEKVEAQFVFFRTHDLT
jgi:hypothetical protein